MGDFARRLAIVLRSAIVCCGAAVAVLVLSRTLAPVVRLLFDHVTTLRVLAVVVLFGVCSLVVRLMHRPAATPDRATDDSGSRIFGGLLGRVPNDVVLGAIVGCSVGAWFAVAYAAQLPSVFGDELVYSGLGKGVARGDGISLLGTPEHGYGILYPLAIAPAYRLATDGTAAYEWIKATNTIVMSVAAIAAYFLARRLASRNWALVVAGLTVALPAMAYGRLVMTEPFAYTAFLTFALTVVRALETPTLARQLVCLVTLAITIGIRIQGVALVPALVAAVVVFGVSAGEVGAVLRRFAPTWILLGLGIVLALAVARGHPRALLGSYSVLARSYGVRGLLEWLAWTTATLEFAAAIVPAFALCVVAPRLLRRSATTGERAMGAVTVSWTTWIVASTTIISASPYGLDRLHERNVFYLLPLLFACLAYWIEQGRPAPARLALPILIVLVVLPAGLPGRLVHTDSRFDAPSMFPWANVDAHLGPLPVGVVMGLAAALAITWASLSRLTILPVLVVVTIFYTVIAEAAYREPPTTVAERSAWVDDALSRSARVTLLHVDASARCQGAPKSPTAGIRLTEFFNVSVDRVVHLFADSTTRRSYESPGARRRRWSPDRRRRLLRPSYVVTEANVRLVGRRVNSTPTPDGLSLWRPDQPLRLATPWTMARGPKGNKSCSLEKLMSKG